MNQSFQFATAFALGCIIYASAAEAADLYAPKGIAPPLPPTISWSGVYAGISSGYAWQRPALSFSGLPAGVTSPGANYDMNRLFIDGTVGADLQLGNGLVVGLLGDAEWGPKSDNQIVTLTSTGPTPPAGTYPFPTTLKTGMTYDVLGRAGFLAAPQALIYGLAGWTWQQNSFSYTDPNGGGAGVAKSYTYGANVNGWTIGLGAESRITPSLSLKAEYRYTKFGTPTAGLSGNTFGIGSVALRSNEQRILVGLNLRLAGL